MYHFFQFPSIFPDHAASTNHEDPSTSSNILPCFSSLIPVRRSITTRNPPTWLHDFLVPPNHIANFAHSFSLTHILLYSSSHDHVAFLANLFTAQKLSTYNQAKQDNMRVGAMNKELDALVANQTWDFILLPSSHKVLPSKWVYKLKFKIDGSIDRPKARLVIKGFNQQLGGDHKHTFAFVAKLDIVRVVISLTVAQFWPLYQLDINNAFLHEFLDENIYMLPL